MESSKIHTARKSKENRAWNSGDTLRLAMNISGGPALIEPFVNAVEPLIYLEPLRRRLILNLLPDGPEIKQAQERPGQF